MFFTLFSFRCIREVCSSNCKSMYSYTYLTHVNYTLVNKCLCQPCMDEEYRLQFLKVNKV